MDKLHNNLLRNLKWYLGSASI